MPENLNIQEITEADAMRSGAIIGALIGGFLWRTQHDSPGAVTLPINQKAKQKKWLSATQAAELLEVGKTKFYELAEQPDFPQRHKTPSGAMKYLASDIIRYNSKRLKA